MWDTAKAKELWQRGETARKIAEAVGAPSRNAVIGMAHRHRWGCRKEPILKARPANDVTALRECQWPHGHPGTPDFHFCGAPAKRGKPYCDAHCKRAYRPAPEAE